MGEHKSKNQTNSTTGGIDSVDLRVRTVAVRGQSAPLRSPCPCHAEYSLKNNLCFVYNRREFFYNFQF